MKIPCCLAAAIAVWCGSLAAEDAASKRHAPSRKAVARSLPLLACASAGSADQRKCFTCHSQALPVLAIVEGSRRGFDPDRENLQRQVAHTHAHLKRGSENYKQGRGQGGGVDTAGYALWTLEDGGRSSDDVTTAVTTYLIKSQQRSGHWKTSSKRPPSEASNFTGTYLALRALSVFGAEGQQADIDAALKKAAQWLANAEPKDTEDRVFRLLSLRYVDDSAESIGAAAAELSKRQAEDGGWSQKDDMASDAYATGTVLYALAEAGMDASDPVYRRGVQFLLGTQLDDGSWHVVSRSKPFQTYFETGFPHEKDQFISTTASAWATISVLRSLPLREAGSDSRPLRPLQPPLEELDAK